MVAAFATNSAVLAAPANTTARWALCSLKENYVKLLHQADIAINGKTVEETQPYLGQYVNIKMLSEMSQTDLKYAGVSLGLQDELDTPISNVWTTTAKTGLGLTNNVPFGNSGTTLNATAATMATGVQLSQGVQHYGAINAGLQRRVCNIVDSTAGQDNI